MRLLVLTLGGVIALVGSVWALQGLGLLLGSFMSNDPTWLWIGVATVLLGAVVLGFGLRSPRT